MAAAEPEQIPCICDETRKKCMETFPNGEFPPISELSGIGYLDCGEGKCYPEYLSIECLKHGRIDFPIYNKNILYNKTLKEILIDLADSAGLVPDQYDPFTHMVGLANIWDKAKMCTCEQDINSILSNRSDITVILLAHDEFDNHFKSFIERVNANVAIKYEKCTMESCPRHGKKCCYHFTL